MRRRGTTVLWFLLAFVAVSTSAWAQPADTSLTIGGRVWVTTGYSLNSSQVSDLRWRGVDSIVPEVNVDWVFKRLVVMGSLGGGAIKEGVLIDEDFNDSNHEQRISRTRSDTDDTGLLYINADVGYRLVQWGTREQPGFIDGLVGFQYWWERYVAFGATSAFPNVVPPISSGVRVITQDWHWYSFRLGGRTQVPLFDNLSLKARAFVLPWSKSVVNDVHQQRTDLRHDPSFHDEADGGIGVQVDGGLTYRIWRGLSVEAGYQYWRISSGSGTSTAHTVFGDFDSNLRENRTERHGPYVGVQYRF
jgi:opacity protein-like surface antigen